MIARSKSSAILSSASPLLEQTEDRVFCHQYDEA
jgi:hypothetical protein